MAEKYWTISDYHIKRLPLIVRKALALSASRLADEHGPHTPAPDILPLLSLHFVFQADSLSFAIRDANGNPL